MSWLGILPVMNVKEKGLVGQSPNEDIILRFPLKFPDSDFAWVADILKDFHILYETC